MQLQYWTGPLKQLCWVLIAANDSSSAACTGYSGTARVDGFIQRSAREGMRSGYTVQLCVLVIPVCRFTGSRGLSFQAMHRDGEAPWWPRVHTARHAIAARRRRQNRRALQRCPPVGNRRLVWQHVTQTSRPGPSGPRSHASSAVSARVAHARGDAIHGEQKAVFDVLVVGALAHAPQHLHLHKPSHRTHRRVAWPDSLDTTRRFATRKMCLGRPHENSQTGQRGYKPAGS